jgi:ABC-type antimicrobial peptide transport system permease subunit
LGQGALVATSDFPTSLLNLQGSSIPGPNLVVVRIRADVNATAAYRSLQEIDRKVNKIPAASGSAGGIVKVLRPAEIVNFRSMGTTPAVLAGGLAIGAVVALALTLLASVRRKRRELALLKALGFTQRQLAASIAWQSSVASFIGCLLGIPLGIIVGRQLWIHFARGINAVPRPTVPVLSVVLVGLGAMVFANLVAAIPGRSAARTSTALVLRAE